MTTEGIPKLLDFGVARALTGDSDGARTAATIERPFTPEYASPEQVMGLAMTTSTDIYSLGVVFYELLTGQRAQPISTPTQLEVERAVCAGDPPRPSQIKPSIDADLDNIVMLAIRKEPERRYHSVDQFAEDIQSGTWMAGRSWRGRIRLLTGRVSSWFETACRLGRWRCSY